MNTGKPEKETFASDTSQRSAADWAKALLVLLMGLTVAHLGVTLFLLTELGTDTFTVLIQGLAVTFGRTVGTIHVIVLCLLMAVMLFTTKGYVKPGFFAIMVAPKEAYCGYFCAIRSRPERVSFSVSYSANR